MNTELSACKVVAQYHSAGEMVYELASAGTKLDVRVSSRVLSSGERSWHVAAQPAASDSIAITDFAATKAEALTKVAAQWEEQEQALGLPKLDWKAVAKALLAVRGI